MRLLTAAPCLATVVGGLAGEPKEAVGAKAGRRPLPEGYSPGGKVPELSLEILISHAVPPLSPADPPSITGYIGCRVLFGEWVGALSLLPCCQCGVGAESNLMVRSPSRPLGCLF